MDMKIKKGDFLHCTYCTFNLVLAPWTDLIGKNRYGSISLYCNHCEDETNTLVWKSKEEWEKLRWDKKRGVQVD